MSSRQLEAILRPGGNQTERHTGRGEKREVVDKRKKNKMVLPKAYQGHSLVYIPLEFLLSKYAYSPSFVEMHITAKFCLLAMFRCLASFER